MLTMAASTLPIGICPDRSFINFCSGVAFSLAAALARCTLLRAPWISGVRK